MNDLEDRPVHMAHKSSVTRAAFREPWRNTSLHTYFSSLFISLLVDARVPLTILHNITNLDLCNSEVCKLALGNNFVGRFKWDMLYI